MKTKLKTLRLFSKIAKILAPPPILKVSEWADRYRRLPSESAEPGQWDTSRAPYQREIMDAVNDPACTDIIIMSSAQVGKTEILLNIIGYFVDYDPAPIMVVQPTLEMAKTFSKDRLAPMIRDTPVLKRKVKEAKSKSGDNAILHKRFVGGHITMVGANSAAGLASRPIRILLCDEVDRYPASAGSEGSPVDLAEKRTTTFWNAKKVKVSTPTIKGKSKIESEFLKSSMEEWCLPCPECGKYQPLEWRRLIFETKKLKCLYCGKSFSENEWKDGEGKFIGNGNRAIRGFHLNELASPWRHWDKLIEAFKKANNEAKESGSYVPLMTWINTTLGETWEEMGGESIDEEGILLRREHYDFDVPDEVLILTAGVDVQKDRFEIEVVGWGENYESWGIQYDQLYCDMSSPTAWSKLEEYLDKKYYRSDNTAFTIACAFVDTGGLYTDATYKFLKAMAIKQKNIFGIKGMRGAGIPILYKVSQNNAERIKILILGVSAGKELVMSRLLINELSAGYCHFPNNPEKHYSAEYFKGLTSEKKIIKSKDNGDKEIIWQKKTATIRNEPLDIRNYATAAVELLKPNWDALKKRVGKPGVKENAVKKSNPQKTKKRVKKGISV